MKQFLGMKRNDQNVIITPFICKKVGRVRWSIQIITRVKKKETKKYQKRTEKTPPVRPVAIY